MSDDLDDLRQLIKNAAANCDYISCDGCRKQTIVADVCPLCFGTYCGQCIIAHVEAELARLEEQWGVAEAHPAELACEAEDDFA